MSVNGAGSSKVLPDEVDFLYDKSLVPDIAKIGLPDDVIARPLARDDHTRNHISLLSNLTQAPALSPSDYTARFDLMRSCPSTYFTLVLQHVPSNTVIASATLMVELKFIRNAGKVGHIEDVVVDPRFGAKGYGARLIKSLETMARGLGCYKTILDCAKDNIGFYEKCGFKHKEYEMVCYAPITEDNSVPISAIVPETASTTAAPPK